MNNYEQSYYENPELWIRERFINTQCEIDRYKTAIKWIPNDTSNLLDIGCGNGAFLYFLEKEKPHIKCTGFERSVMAIKMKLCHSEIMNGDIISLPFKNEEYDIVTLFEILEHLPYNTFNIALKEIQRVSKKYILISVPYREKRLFIKCYYCGCLYNPYYHIRSFDENKLKNLFTKYKLVKIQPFFEIKEYIGLKYIQKFKNMFVKKENIIMTAICPMCGYKEDNVKNNYIKQREYYTYIKNIIKYLWPKTKNYRWVFAIYEKFK